MRRLARPFISYSHLDAQRIAALAAKLRSELNLAPHKRFPIVPFLEFQLTDLWKDFRLVIESDDDFEELVLATAKNEPPEITVRESVYQHAVNGSAVARVILAHELGHVILRHGSNPHQIKSDEQEGFSVVEWQADEFAAELLMPSQLTMQMTSDEIAGEFAVPLRSAELRLQTLKTRQTISSAAKIPRFEHHIDLLSKFDKQLLRWMPRQEPKLVTY